MTIKEQLIKKKKTLFWKEAGIIFIGIILFIVTPLIIFIPALIVLYFIEKPIREESDKIKKKLEKK